MGENKPQRRKEQRRVRGRGEGGEEVCMILKDKRTFNCNFTSISAPRSEYLEALLIRHSRFSVK
jgi:hypothetical protein